MPSQGLLLPAGEGVIIAVVGIYSFLPGVSLCQCRCVAPVVGVGGARCGLGVGDDVMCVEAVAVMCGTRC